MINTQSKSGESKVCGLILAAGFSSRMGRIKPLLKLSGGNILEKTTESLFAAGIEDIVLVLGCHAEKIMAEYRYREAVHLVYNLRYAEGMFSSVRAGVQAIAQSGAYDAFLMLPADCPLVSPATVCKVVAAYYRSKADIVRPSYQGRCGHPCLISLDLADEIIWGDFPEGMRSLIRQNPSRVKTIAVDDPGILVDIDTPEAYQRICAAGFTPR